MSTARRRLKFFGPYSPKLGLLPLEDRAVPAVMLDTSFNTTGLFVRDVAGFSDTVNAVAVQADGGILLAGSTRSSGVTGDDFIITRLTPAGKLDTTFGPTSNGSIIIDLAAAAGTAGLNDAAKAIVIDSKGRILVAGSVERTGNASVFGIVRLDSAGKLDLSFNTDGITTVDFGGGEDFASAIAVSDARIIVAGISITPGVAPDHRFAVTALNEQGGPDGAFGGGIALYSTGKIDNTVAGVSIRANGSVVLAGTIATPDLATPTVQTTDFGLVQFTAAGLLDATFGIGGVAKSSFAGLLADRAFGAVFNPVDGSITVVGKTTLDPVSADFAVTQFNASGGVVSTFGTAGRLTARFAQSSQANAVAIDKTGALIVAGEVGTGADRDYAAIRIVNGQLDTAFGTSGKLIQDFPGANDFDGALAVAVQPDGRIVIAGQGGSASVDQTVARFTAPDGPVVVPPLRRGFGSHVIERDYAHELDGTVQLDYRTEGVVCTMNIPAPMLEHE